MRIVVLQHVAFEGPGSLADWAAAKGHPLRIVRLDRGEGMPSTDELDALVVMGGPMGVADESAFPWLRGEKRLVAAAVAAGRHVLGICLGAQVLAGVLGSRVFPGRHREVGWHAIEWTDEGRALDPFRGMPASEIVFHWHGDSFELPEGAISLASSAACRCQGFAARSGRVVGLQFHLELRPADIDLLVAAGQEDLMAGGPYVQPAEEISSNAPVHCARLGLRFHDLLDRWISGKRA